jgi:hypothetical protein
MTTVRAWTSTCLPCNATWTGTARHVHDAYLEYRRGFWAYRLHRALKTETHETAANLVEYPMPRWLMVRLMGKGWAV